MRVLCTGAGGFVGAEVVRQILATTDWDVVAVDGFRHRGITDRLSMPVGGVCPLDYLDGGPGLRDRLTFIVHDLAVPISPQMAARIGPVDVVLALAAGSHVGASLVSPREFVENNVAVMLTTLEYARVARPVHVVLVSTDEVYGPVVPGLANVEWDSIVPSTPYSASKAAQEALAVAWWRSFGVPVTITNMHNVYGPMQGGEKFIPLAIRTIRDGGLLGIHGDEAHGGGSRCWLHVRDVASALIHVARVGPMLLRDGVGRPNRWNIANGERLSNVETAQMIADRLGLPLRWVWSDARPGHDQHYGLDGSKLAAVTGWKPVVGFEQGLGQTVDWYVKNPEWLVP